MIRHRPSRRRILRTAAAGTVLAAAPTPDVRARADTKATFVLVHPAWFGGWCWKKIIPLLRARGHDVFAPTLTGLGERAHLAQPSTGLDTHINDVVSHLKFEGLSRVILVGNSSGGVVITGVADRAPSQVAHIVYLDAFVPEDGQSLLDMLPPDRRAGMEALVQAEGDGWLLPRFAAAPWETIVPQAWRIGDEADQRWVLPRLRPTPFGHFKEPVRRKSAAAEALPRTYIRCREFPNPAFDRFAEAARKTPGWRHRELATSHIPYVTNPDELAETLLEIAG